MKTLGDKLCALRDGRIKFAEFHRLSREDWRKMAAKLFRRWSLPSGVTEEDVEQEMLLSAWKATADYQPDRGMTLVGYVVWVAHSDAKKWIHRQRSAKRRDDHAPSRHARCLSGFNPSDEKYSSNEDTVIDRLICTEADQELLTEWRLAIESMPSCADSGVGSDAMGAWVMAGGDPDIAGCDLFSDPVLRLEHELDSEEHAVKVVRREVGRVRRALLLNEEA